MSKKVKWWVAVGLLLAAFGMTLSKEPQAISQALSLIAARLVSYSLFMHAVFLAVVAAGLIFSGARARLWGGFMAALAASAATVALAYFILPNILVFGLYFALILHALWRGEVGWELGETTTADRLFGVIGLVFGFWYLHWVESPLLLNALLFSPLGVLNCPTMLAISGFLCLASQRPPILDFVSGVVCVYFGLFGIFLLGAYVDLALLACGAYQLARLAITAKRGASMKLGTLEQA
jgi:hypothetical protein